jgi:hypothetical protein
MKFHSIVLRPDGIVAAREEIDSASLFSDKTRRRMVREHSKRLGENSSGSPFETRAFSAEVGEPGMRCLMQWHQVEPMSALATFVIDGRPALLSILLAGFVPEMDAIVVKATRTTLADRFKESGLDPGPGLSQVTERPALINIPSHALPPREGSLVVRASNCLALAFFLRAEACFETMKEQWRQQCKQGQARSGRFRKN